MWLLEPLCWFSWCAEGVVFLYALVVVAIERRAASRAARPLQAGPLPRVGPIALEGTVLTDGDPAITVRIDEVGQFINPEAGWRGLLFGRRRGRWGMLLPTPTQNTFIRWREFDRAMQVNAFTLRLDDGTTVRVAPDASVYLVDDLVKAENVEHDHRVRRVSLDHEERAFVTGVLRVDRSTDPKAPTGVSHVVRSGGQHRLFISTHAIDTVHTERAKRYGYVALGALTTGLVSLLGAVVLDSVFIPIVVAVVAGWFGVNAYRRMRPWWEGATLDEER
jgi:hypothetical protein